MSKKILMTFMAMVLLTASYCQNNNNRGGNNNRVDNSRGDGNSVENNRGDNNHGDGKNHKPRINCVHIRDIKCPSIILKNGESQSGNFLSATFEKGARIDKVKVVLNGNPTTDISSLNGYSGVWTSQNKYNTTKVTLQLLDNSSKVLNTCLYDDSDSTPIQANDAQIINQKATKIGANVVVSWHSNLESNVKAYIVERINANTGGKDRSDLNIPKVGPNTDYSATDDEVFEDTSIYSYNILVSFEDNTIATLQADIKVAP